MQRQPITQLLFVVEHVIVADAAETAPAKGGGDGVGVGTAHLKFRDRVAGLDQFISG